jgi:orotate phosphoribosyltransferase
MAADQLKLPYVYVRPKPKEHGLGNQIEGYYESGKKVLVVEDLISTGKSSLQVVEALRKAGMEVIGMVAIFTYGFSVAEQSFSEAGVPLKTLTNYETLIDLSIQKGRVLPEQEIVLKKWAENPQEWNGGI